MTAGNQVVIRGRSTGLLHCYFVDEYQGKIANFVSGSYETPTTADWGDYTIALTEQSSTQLYFGTLPSIAPTGIHNVWAYQGSASAAAPSDTQLGGGYIDYQAASSSIDFGASNVPSAVWQDSLSNGDFSITGTIGQLAYSALIRIGSGVIQVTSPQAISGSINFVRGGTYAATENNLFMFSDTLGIWPNLSLSTGVSVGFDNGSLVLAGETIAVGGTTQTVAFGLGSATSTLFKPGTHNLTIISVQTSGDTIPLVTGTAEVTDNQLLPVFSSSVGF